MKKHYKKLMIIGSGPIVIGQAAEFDYSGSQACKSVREEGYSTVLINSNPATIQTDVDMAESVYIEPLETGVIEEIIKKEKVDGILAGMGGQTALNICSDLDERGILKKYGVDLLGTQPETIRMSENRELFKELMEKIREPIPKSKSANSVVEAIEAVKYIGSYPVLIRPAFTLGGTGSGIAHNEKELKEICAKGLASSRIHQVLIEESVLGWKEYEYEVMRDANDNCIVVCSMENIDAMGIHTGDSIVCAPILTISNTDHHRLRSSAIKVIRALGIKGGCNVQFAFNPENNDYRLIEVNPRVSRSSALASKATGYPIARVSAKISLGYTLDKILNKITGTTAAFEPTIDYVVVKIPRWPFDKFCTVDRHLGTQMKSTGEIMSIGCTFEEAILKGIRSLDIGAIYLDRLEISDEEIEKELRHATDRRIFAIAEALRRGFEPEQISKLVQWDNFFISKIKNIIDMENILKTKQLTPELLKRAKRMGFADVTIATLTNKDEINIREMRKNNKIIPVYKTVDTCAAEFEAKTPYFYSTYGNSCEAKLKKSKKNVVIIGGGPIRIGQGIEFDYCCVHGVLALQEIGIDAIIINNNPETVSTDFDISDRLYFEPLTLEDVLNVIEKENADGVIVQFGGQTSVNLAVDLEKALSGTKTKILGTSPDMIDVAEDRMRFSKFIFDLGIKQPASGTGYSFDEAKKIAEKIGYPVLIRPSYVLGGRGMEILYSAEELKTYIESAVKISRNHPVLIDKYLTEAIELDVDVIADGKDVYVGGIMEHIEYAGVHSGDATMVLPPNTLEKKVIDQIIEISKKIALALQIKGFMNLQMALKDEEIWMIEVNPRASRTIPFISKATGIPLIKIGTQVMLGKTLKEIGIKTDYKAIDHFAIKASVFPFSKLSDVDPILTPEMKSTGEVMGIDENFYIACYKAYIAAGIKLPIEGGVYISVNDTDKPKILDLSKKLYDMGFNIYATKGTSTFLKKNGIKVTTIFRLSYECKLQTIEYIKDKMINMIINTPSDKSGTIRDGCSLRRLAVELEIPFLTTVNSASAAVAAINTVRRKEIKIKSMKEHCGLSY